MREKQREERKVQLSLDNFDSSLVVKIFVKVTNVFREGVRNSEQVQQLFWGKVIQDRKYEVTPID